MAGTAAGAAKRAAARAGAATPTDRKAPATRVRRPTAAELEQMPAAQVETENEGAVLADGELDLEFGGDVYRLTSPADWRQSAMTALRTGDWNGWAAGGAMDAASAKLFVKRDFTNRRANEFMAAFDLEFRARYGEDPTQLARLLGL